MIHTLICAGLPVALLVVLAALLILIREWRNTCLLYTSDAADE